MTQFLVIRLAEPVSWVIVDATGGRLGPVATGTLEDAAPLAAERRVVALAPAADVMLAEPELPVRGGARLAQVVPFALEESLAGDVEAMHFAAGRVGPDGRTPVAGTERERMDAWLAQFTAAGIALESLLPEALCLPSNPGKIVALLEAGQLYVRAPGQVPVVIAAEPLTEAFALAGLEGEDRHVQLFVTEEDWDTCRDMVEALREVTGTLDVQLLPDGALPLLAAGAVAAPPLSLLTGDYAPRTGLAAHWRRWRLVAGLAAAVLLLHVGTSAFELIRLGGEERRLDAAIQSACQVAIPGGDCAGQPLEQMRARLGRTASADPAGLLGRLDSFAQAMAGTSGVRIRSLGWRDRMLDLRISAPSSEVLSQLSRAAGQRGLSFDLQSTIPSDSGVDGLVSIRPAGQS